MRISDWSSDVCSSDLGIAPDGAWLSPRSLILFSTHSKRSFPKRSRPRLAGVWRCRLRTLRRRRPWSDGWLDRTDLEFSTRPEAAESEVPPRVDAANVTKEWSSNNRTITCDVIRTMLSRLSQTSRGYPTRRRHLLARSPFSSWTST